MDAPDFINISQGIILDRWVENYESLTGKKLQPAQAEQLIINSGSYEVYMHAVRIQNAALQNLVQFAEGNTLDLLVQPFGVTRLPATASKCNAVITLVPGHGVITIPAGTRVQSIDGAATFLLTKDIVTSIGVDTINVELLCDTPGGITNGYVAGKVNVLMDPRPYLISIVNTSTTTGGADLETDERLRDRVYDSVNAYSTAGSRASYWYLAKSASALITDVSIPASPGNGVVNIYPLVASGTTPTGILDLVAEACNAEDKRPLTDTVNVIAPGIVDYAISVDLVVYESADQAAVVTTVTAQLQALAAFIRSRIGIDAVRSQISAAASLAGSVYKVTVNAPPNDVLINETQVANCIGITVSITGTNADL